MLIAGVNTSHHGSVCLLKDGELVFYIEEERLSRKKYDDEIIFGVKKIKEYSDCIDYVVVCNTRQHEHEMKLLKSVFPTSKIIDYRKIHHLCHASLGFYNSSFDEALCFVLDGSGSRYNGKKELESVYFAQNPNKFVPVFKHYNGADYKSDKVNFYSNGLSVGGLFEGTCLAFGFHPLDGGKVMGLSSFGKSNTQIPEIFVNGNAEAPFFFGNNTGYFYGIPKEDIAYEVQTQTENHVIEMIKKYSSEYNCKNIILTGGYALNCVANYKYLDLGLNIYVEPISHDGGTAIGAAKYFWYKLSKSQKRYSHDTLYYGFDYEVPNENNTSYDEIVSLLIDEHPVCIFQGKSEAGPRALGNRSILYNPTVKDGKNILNKMKHRENFRPFAAVVLEEFVHEWFNMKGLNSSPFMMYAVQCKDKYKHKIPAVLQVDGTSRVQTVTEKTNAALYKLIKMFYNETGIPMLLNTSFNLAGEPLVETPADAIHTMKNSEFNYLYFPETHTLRRY